MRRLVGLIVAAFVLAGPVMAQPGGPGAAGEPKPTPRTLNLGDTAPPLVIAKWVKGEPITQFEPGKVYIVQFWTTWCTPCHEVFPLYNEIVKKYPDVAIVGVSFTDTKGESIEKVIPFVQQMGDRMNFRVAFDDDRKTILSYMDASGYKEIPTAYIVNQHGRIVWMGHPMDHMTEALDQVVANNYDLSAAIIADRRKTEMLERAKPFEARLHEAYQKGDAKAAFELTDQLVSMDANYFGKYAAIKFSWLVTKSKNYPEAYKYTQWLLTGPFKDNSQALNRMAWMIMDDPGVEQRDYEMALKLARRANEIQRAKDPDVMDTLARAYFEKGDVDKAIEWQGRAMDAAKPEARKAMQESMDKYKARKAAGAAGPQGK